MDEIIETNLNPASEPGRSPRKRGGFLALAAETVKVAVIALVIILPVRYFVMKPFYVNGASMEPNYFDHEYLIIDEISYRFNSPARGEVVVFHYPMDPSQYFIKRIIGLPGDKVTVKDGRVLVYNQAQPEGAVLDEPYLTTGMETVGSADATLGANEYFVLGDNRRASLDSRRFGPIKKENIIGRTWLRGWPIDRAGVLEGYKFNF